jgi:hypothetical protein
VSAVTDPNAIRRELGLTEPPFSLNDIRRYMGVRVLTDTGVRSGGVTTWRPGGTITIALPPGSVERQRQTGSHELGHVANGDVGPDVRVLYARGSGRGARLNDAIERRATEWGIDALIGQGPLGIAIRHDGITTAAELALRFHVYPKFLMQAAARYGFEHLVLRDPDGYAKYLNSVEWIRRSNEILTTRRFCELPSCGAASEVVSHLRYDGLGFERSEDVQVLCRVCSNQVDLRAAMVTQPLAMSR